MYCVMLASVPFLHNFYQRYDDAGDIIGGEIGGGIGGILVCCVLETADLNYIPPTSKSQCTSESKSKSTKN